MTDRLPAPVRKVGDTFKSFTPGQKAVTIFAILALAIGAGALWLSERSGMGVSDAMQGASVPMEHQLPGEASRLIAPGPA